MFVAMVRGELLQSGNWIGKPAVDEVVLSMRRIFLLWLFPIGVWFIQPRINRLSGRVTDGI